MQTQPYNHPYCCQMEVVYVSAKKEDLVIDMKAKTVFREGKEIKLTRKEYDLLILLYSDRGRVFSTEEILLNCWGIDWQTESNTVQVYISFIRNKVDRGFEKKLIQTRGCYGYFIDK